MLEAIIKGDSASISAKLELKLDEYDNLISKRIVRDKLFYSVPYACTNIFETDLFPVSNSNKVYAITIKYKDLFIKLGCTLDEFELALNNTRKILINKTSLALLMLIYNDNFREFCNVTETKKEIMRHLKLELDKHIQL